MQPSGSIALLPQLPGSLPSPKGPRGIQNQPHLSALLRRLLSEVCTSAMPLSQFMNFAAGLQDSSVVTMAKLFTHFARQPAIMHALHEDLVSCDSCHAGELEEINYRQENSKEILKKVC